MDEIEKLDEIVNWWTKLKSGQNCKIENWTKLKSWTRLKNWTKLKIGQN